MIGIIEFCAKFVICIFVLALTFTFVCAVLATFKLFFDAINIRDWDKAKTWMHCICIEAVLFGVIWFLF